jgi:hypothetical protein
MLHILTYTRAFQGDDSSANQTELAPKLSLPSDLHNNNTGNKLAHPSNNNHAPSSLHDVSQTISLQSSPAHFAGGRLFTCMDCGTLNCNISKTLPTYLHNLFGPHVKQNSGHKSSPNPITRCEHGGLRVCQIRPNNWLV